jgi:hypothetical protein
LSSLSDPFGARARSEEREPWLRATVSHVLGVRHRDLSRHYLFPVHTRSRGSPSERLNVSDLAKNKHEKRSLVRKPLQLQKLTHLYHSAT